MRAQKSKHSGSKVRVRFYNQQSSSSQAKVVDPYGGLGRRAAYSAYNQFAQPLLGYFGGAPEFGEGRRGRRQEARYNERMQSFMDSPLGQYAEQYKAFMPDYLSQSQEAGQRIASLAPEIFDMLRGQIGTAIGQLPQIQQEAQNQVGAARDAYGYSQRGVEQAFSPIANQALYQNALRDVLGQAQSGAAARGLLDSGGAQQMEDILSRDLAAQYAQNAFGQQQAALAGQQQALGGRQAALGAQAGLLPLGAQLAGMQGGALEQLASALQSGYQLPADALQNVFAQLAAFANPALAVGQLAAPTVTSTSRSSGFGIL